MQYYFGLTVHLVLVVVFLISPFMVSWEIILLSVVVYILFFSIYLKYCPLTKFQFGHTKQTFYEHYLNKIGFRISKKQASILAGFITPLAILVVSFIWQVVFGNKPWIG